MRRIKKTSVLPTDGVQGAKTNKDAHHYPVWGVVIQDNCSANEDREAFMQAITSHGMAFLRCVNTTLPKPSSVNLSIFEKLARVLSGLCASAVRRAESKTTIGRKAL